MRVRLSAALAALACLAAVPAVAQAAPAAGGLQANINPPVLSSAQVTGPNTVQACFTKPLTAVIPSAFSANSSLFALYGFDANRELDATSATIAASSSACLDLNFPNDARSPSVSEFTRLTVYANAVSSPTGDNFGAAAALAGSAEAPRLGNTAGPDLLGGTSAASTVTFTFDQSLDPNPTLPTPSGSAGPTTSLAAGLGYYAADGTIVHCLSSPSPTISGNTVTCTVPGGSPAPVRYFALNSAVRDRPSAQACCDTSPVGAVGAGNVARPSISNATQTGPTQVTLTYDQPVSPRSGTVGHYLAVASDSNTQPSQSVAQGSGPTQIVVTFPAALANAAYKVVGIADPGAADPNGAPVQTSGGIQSATIFRAIRTAPTQPGRLDAPDLHAVQVNPATNTAIYTFYGLIAGTPDKAKFFVVDQNGNPSFGQNLQAVQNDPGTATSNVIITFAPGVLQNAKAAGLSDRVVGDFALKLGRRNLVATSTVPINPGGGGQKPPPPKKVCSPRCSTKTPRPRLGSHARGQQVTLNISGQVRKSAAARSVPRCSGTVRVIVRLRGLKRNLRVRTVRLGSACRYRTSFTIRLRSLPRRFHRLRTRLAFSVQAHYNGNGQLRPSTSPPARVTFVVARR